MSKLRKLRHLIKLVRMIVEANSDGRITADEVALIIDSIEDALEEYLNEKTL